MNSWTAFLKDWKTWSPQRMEDALSRPIECQNKKCRHRFAPMETMNMRGPAFLCPECKREVWGQLFLRWQGDGLVCSSCGGETRTKYAVLRQNIGMLVVRRFGDISGNMCKWCIRRHFWPMTAKTVAVGWIGVMSLIVTPFYVLGNMLAYARTIFMRGPRSGVRRPNLDEQKIAKLIPHADQILNRLNADEPRLTVARSIAQQAGVSPVETVLFSQGLVFAHLTDLVDQRRPA